MNPMSQFTRGRGEGYSGKRTACTVYVPEKCFHTWKEWEISINSANSNQGQIQSIL